MNYFSKNLTYLLKETRTQQKDVAEILGVKPNTISNYKNAVSEPNFDQLEKLVQYFNLNADYLLYCDIEAEGLMNKSSNLTPTATDTDSQKLIDLAIQLGEQINENKHLYNENMDLRGQISELREKEKKYNKPIIGESYKRSSTGDTLVAEP